MFAKSIVILSLIAVLLLISFMIYRKYTFQMEPIKPEVTLTPENSIILFDLHDVIFKQDWAKTIKILFGRKEGLIFMINFLRPPFLFKSLSLMFHEGSWKEFVDFLNKNYPQLLKHTPLMEEVINAQEVIPQTVEIIKDLKKRGYTLHIASNIGEQFFDHLKKEYPNIIDQFDAVKIISSNMKGDVVKKPGAEFFKEYLTEFNPSGKYIVFVDNFGKSVKVADQFGIIGIKYYNPSQLRKYFKYLGIL